MIDPITRTAQDREEISLRLSAARSSPAAPGSGARYVEEFTDPVTGETTRVDAETLAALDQAVNALVERAAEALGDHPI
jgi:hypothetical protein